MKIEIRKEIRWDRTIFWTYVDNLIDHAHFTEDEADKRFQELVANASKPPVIEILKVAEI